MNYAIQFVCNNGAKKFLLSEVTKLAERFPSNAAAHRQAERLREANNSKPKYLSVNVVPYPKRKGVS